MTETEAKDIAHSIERLVNGFDVTEATNALVSELTSTHRTLQSSIIDKIVIPIVRTMAERGKQGWYDARNEYACKACEAMLIGLRQVYPDLADGKCGIAMV